MGHTYQQQMQYRCPSNTCQWTNLEPVLMQDGNHQCAECNRKYLLWRFTVRTVERETMD